MTQIFKDLVTVVGEKATTTKGIICLKDKEGTHKLMLQEHKVRVHDERIMMVDTSRTTPEDAAYYESRKAEIKCKRFKRSSSTEYYVSPAPDQIHANKYLVHHKL